MQEARDYLNKLRTDSTTLPQYDKLTEIIDTVPELRAEAFEAFQKSLSSEKTNGKSLAEAYKSLKTIDKAHPELISDVLRTYKQALVSEKNTTASLEVAFENLWDITVAHPEKNP